MYRSIKEKIMSDLMKRWGREGEINHPLWHSAPWESQCWQFASLVPPGVPSRAGQQFHITGSRDGILA